MPEPDVHGASVMVEDAARLLSSPAARVQDYAHARELFRQALALDPDSSAAAYGLEQAGRAQVAMAGNGAAAESARLAARAAVAVNQARTVQDMESVLSDFAVALELDPTSDLARYGHEQAAKGKAMLLEAAAAPAATSPAPATGAGAGGRLAKVKAWNHQRRHQPNEQSAETDRGGTADGAGVAGSVLVVGSLADMADRVQGDREAAAAARAVQHLDRALLAVDGAVFSSAESPSQTGSQQSSRLTALEQLYNDSVVQPLAPRCSSDAQVARLLAELNRELGDSESSSEHADFPHPTEGIVDL